MIVNAKAKEQIQLREDISAQMALQLLPERTVTTDGLDFSLNWRAALGATDAVVETAWIDLTPVSSNDTGLAVEASLTPSGKGFEVALNGPVRPVRSVRLNGLKAAGVNRQLMSRSDVIGLSADLPGDGDPWRLCVSIDQGSGFGLVQFAVPFIGQKKQRPALLDGASFSGGVLSLPDVLAKGLRVTLMRGSLPEDFAEQEASLAGAAVRVAPGPVDLEVSDKSGPLWSMPGPFGAGVRVDLKNSIERGFNEDPAAASARVTLKGAAGGRLLSSGIAASGHLLRKFEGKVQAGFEGDSQTLPLGELDARAPGAATADVTIVHEGLCLHPLSADVPAAAGGLSGRVVGSAPALHTLPPEALRGEALVKVGVIGFGVAGKLSLRVLEAAGEKAGQPIVDAFADAELAATPGGKASEVTWLAFATPLIVDRSLALELTAADRFLWVEDDGKPLVRFAVASDPGGSLAIGGKALAITGARTDLVGQSLPVAAFAGGPVVAATDQFCRLTLSNLRLRYAP